MANSKSPEIESIDFDAIEKAIHQGRTVVSAEDSSIIEFATRSCVAGQSLTMYLKPTVFDAIRRWYWTPARVEAFELKPISAEQAAKVKSDFGIEVDGNANSLECPRCGQRYSTYEFIQQGFKEHGEALVRATWSLKRMGVMQINPRQTPICQNCNLRMLASRSPGMLYHYDYWTPADGGRYACCQNIKWDDTVLAATEFSSNL